MEAIKTLKNQKEENGAYQRDLVEILLKERENGGAEAIEEVINILGLGLDSFTEEERKVLEMYIDCAAQVSCEDLDERKIALLVAEMKIQATSKAKELEKLKDESAAIDHIYSETKALCSEIESSAEKLKDTVHESEQKLHQLESYRVDILGESPCVKETQTSQKRPADVTFETLFKKHQRLMEAEEQLRNMTREFGSLEDIPENLGEAEMILQRKMGDMGLSPSCGVRRPFTMINKEYY
eukprot:TRINITY_DN2463_c0_g3_i2.p1 TRINITY_DN2463_c0_g3~~TRINITY_DN2463_c0_g3_i2.p1  ORF type:complete len:240 (+),score=55.21 TRINITY_DN2463_c0_g3_i2:129-848(+)